MISSKAFALPIVDKDRNPVWRPAKLEDVTPDIVDVTSGRSALWN